MAQYQLRGAFDAHELADGGYLLLLPDGHVRLEAPAFNTLFAPAKGNGTKPDRRRKDRSSPERRKPGADRKSAKGRGRVSPEDLDKAVARCLKGESPVRVLEDFTGLKYSTLYSAIGRAKKKKLQELSK